MTTTHSRADALTDDERIVLKTLANWRGLGNRERSALMKILAAPPVEQPEFTDECADCGCLHPGEYWVHPRVWSGSGMAVDGGKLCLVCLEARLQRRLTVADFPADAAINRCVLWDLSEQPAAAPIYPQGVMGIPPYSPSGSGQSQATSALTWNAPAPADERAAFVERVMGMFEAWPNGKPGPTDEPESHYRFGYNTALEDVLTALDVGSPTRRAASANETGAEGAAIELLRKFMEYRDSDYVPNVLFDCARTIIDNAMAAAAPIDEPTELEQVIACLGDDAATLRHADEYVEMADNMEAAARLLESSHGEILQKIGGALGLLAGDDLHRHVLPALHGALDDARRWRAFRDRDSFDNLEYVAFQDQFREDADRIIDAAITEKDEDRAGEEMCNRWPWERVTAPSPADERAASFEAWCDRFPEISAVERLRDAWQEARAAASPAMAAEAVAFEITEQAAAEWASRHDVDHVLKHFSTQRNAIEDARTLHLLAAAPQPAQAGARVGLTDEQRDAIDFVIGWYEQSTIADNPYREHIAALRALLSARPAESWQVEIDAYKREVRELEAVLRIPEKIEDDWIRADVHSPTEAGIPHDDDVLAWNNDPGFATIISASFISPSFPEYTHWKKKPEAPADIDHAKGVDHAE